jgi:hypothetical protein
MRPSSKKRNAGLPAVWNVSANGSDGAEALMQSARGVVSVSVLAKAESRRGIAGRLTLRSVHR